MLRDPVGIANLAAALLLACIAVVTWRRRERIPAIGAALSCVLASLAFWSLGYTLSVSAASPGVMAVAVLASVPSGMYAASSFAWLAMCFYRPQWVPGPPAVAALLVGPVVTTVLAATNPWHLLVFGGPGAARLLDADRWTPGPALWLCLAGIYTTVTLGTALIVRAWWRAPAVFRGDRRVLLIGVVVPALANVAYHAGAFGGASDPTPLLCASAGAIITYAIFRQDLFTFAPVARALIVDQIGDAIVAIGPNGRVLDVNPAAIRLARAMNPLAEGSGIGATEREMFGGSLLGAATQAELTVELPTGRTDFHVRASRLVDGRHRDLGTVLVARDVTAANAQTRLLSAANTRLVRQVATIERLRADLVELASRDPLTGLHNRRHLVDGFEALLTASRTSHTPLTVILIDVDRFKSVNDRYGHLVGDEVLIGLAHRIRDHAPAGALVARWGGEEFFLALPGADLHAGIDVAEDLRSRCERGGIDVDGTTIDCTLSIGVATYPDSGTTMNDLFHAADRTLYEAKNAGRNTVRAHHGTATHTPV